MAELLSATQNFDQWRRAINDNLVNIETQLEEAVLSDNAIPVFSYDTPTHTVVDAELGAILRFASNQPTTITIPYGLGNGHPIGTQVVLRRFGSGEVAIVPALNVELYGLLPVQLTRPHTEARLTKVGPNRWDVSSTRGEVEARTVVVATTTPNQIVDTLSVDGRSAKYVIQVSAGTSFQVSELLVIHDGVSAYATEYAMVATNGTLAAFDVALVAGEVQLQMTPLFADTTIQFTKTWLTVA